MNWHLLEDVLGWTIVLMGSIIMHFGDYSWLDPLMALEVTLFILWNVSKSLGHVIKYIFAIQSGRCGPVGN